MRTDLEMRTRLLELLRGETEGQAACWDAQTTEGIVRLAEEHRVVPYLWARLRDKKIPESLARRLRAGFMENAARNRFLFGQAQTVFAGLASAGIQVIPLKGLYLADAVYSAAPMRYMQDLDIMVRPADVRAADTFIQSLGYLPMHAAPPDELTGRHLSYVHRENFLTIEVHWNLILRGMNVDVEALWNRAHRGRCAGTDVWLLPPEDVLAHLCVHAAGHAFEIGLRSLLDIAEMERRFPALEWDQVRRLLRDWTGSHHCLATNLALANRLLGFPIPDSLADSCSEKGQDAMSDLAMERVFAGVKLPAKTFAAAKTRYSLRHILSWSLWRTAIPRGRDMQKMFPVGRHGHGMATWYVKRLKNLWARRGSMEHELVRHTLRDWMFRSP